MFTATARLLASTIRGQILGAAQYRGKGGEGQTIEARLREHPRTRRLAWEPSVTSQQPDCGGWDIKAVPIMPCRGGYRVKEDLAVHMLSVPQMEARDKRAVRAKLNMVMCFYYRHPNGDIEVAEALVCRWGLRKAVRNDIDRIYRVFARERRVRGDSRAAIAALGSESSAWTDDAIIIPKTKGQGKLKRGQHRTRCFYIRQRCVNHLFQTKVAKRVRLTGGGTRKPGSIRVPAHAGRAAPCGRGARAG